MPASIRIGDLEIKGFSDGLLKTRTDFVIGMDREKADELVGDTDDG